MPTSTSEQALRATLRQRAQAEGLPLLHIATADVPARRGADLGQFLARGHHGTMGWLAETEARRAAPRAMWPAARTAIVAAQPYGQGIDAFARLEQKSTGTIAQYALNRDYHDVLKGKLKRLAGWLAAQAGCAVKVFTDTAPLMEKPLAAQAGLGWQGKHTNLVSRQEGSWFFIGTILTDLVLEADEPEADHCGTCRACLDICPTGAFPAPHQIDARRCISYLTIEHQGHIDPAFRRAMGNRIYGCDDCLAVCPWNKFAAATREMKLSARPELLAPPLAFLLTLDDAAFRAFFAGSPVKRTGRDRFLRNVLIAAGNSGDATLVSAIRTHLADPAPVVRAMAVWALAALLPPTDFAALRAAHESREGDSAVRQEWQVP